MAVQNIKSPGNPDGEQDDELFPNRVDIRVASTEYIDDEYSREAVKYTEHMDINLFKTVRKRCIGI